MCHEEVEVKPKPIHAKHRRSPRIVCTLAVALALSMGVTTPPLQSAERLAAEATTASARETSKSRWIVRGGALWVVSTGDEAGDFTFEPPLSPGDTTQRGLSDGLGFGIELEGLVGRHIGVELAGVAGDLEAELTLDAGGLRSTDTRDIGFTAVMLGVNYHVTPGRRADLYVGAFAQRSDYDDITHRFPGTEGSVQRTFDTALGWGLKAGLDVTFTPASPWILSIAVRHLREPLDIKPIVGSVLFGYRF